MSDPVRPHRPHRRQPTRLPRPRDSPGKNTGVGCYFLLFRLRDQTHVSWGSCIAGGFFATEPTGKPPPAFSFKAQQPPNTFTHSEFLKGMLLGVLSLHNFWNSYDRVVYRRSGNCHLSWVTWVPKFLPEISESQPPRFESMKIERRS